MVRETFNSITDMLGCRYARQTALLEHQADHVLGLHQQQDQFHFVVIFTVKIRLFFFWLFTNGGTETNRSKSTQMEEKLFKTTQGR